MKIKIVKLRRPSPDSIRYVSDRLRYKSMTIVYNNYRLWLKLDEVYVVHHNYQPFEILNVDVPLKPRDEEIQYLKILHNPEFIDGYLACVEYYWKTINNED
mgnify:CR=1 FL=1